MPQRSKAHLARSRRESSERLLNAMERQRVHQMQMQLQQQQEEARADTEEPRRRRRGSAMTPDRERGLAGGERRPSKRRSRTLSVSTINELTKKVADAQGTTTARAARGTLMVAVAATRWRRKTAEGYVDGDGVKRLRRASTMVIT